MKPQDLVTLLGECYAEKLGLKRRHEAGARRIGTYDFNNTYQYVIAREETHLDWLRRAIESLGATPVADGPVPALPAPGPEMEKAIIADDTRLMRAFLDRWRERVDEVSDSRHKLMLRLMLGEMLEQQRFFDQALAGRHDLLGRRTSPSEASGTVLETRWLG